MTYRPILTTLALLLGVACSVESDPTSQASQSLGPDPACLANLELDVFRSIVVTDPAVLDARDADGERRFSFSRTMNLIASTAPGAATAESLLQAVIDSNGESAFTNLETGLSIPVTVRPFDAALVAADLLADPPAVSTNNPRGLIPLGLFNRFDLADPDGAHCGEYRIVYGRPTSGNDRYFLIFESVLPNPDIASGLAGCRPVAEFWADLSANDDAASRTDALEEFYYSGITGFSPVVDNAHYGIPFGQIRSNSFVNFFQWELREYRTRLDLVSGALVSTIAPDTVKTNPLTEFYTDLDAETSANFSFQSELFDDLRGTFQTDFVDNQLSLLAPEETGTVFDDPSQLINSVSMATSSDHGDFASISQGSADSPAAQISADFSDDIDQALTTVSTAHVLNRAGAMTCGGCHQFSNNQPIGDIAGQTVRWPSSAGFVHITESRNLSSALLGEFIPAREDHLKNFVCESDCDGICGDVNDSGNLTTFDLILIRKHILGISVITDECTLKRADMNGSGTITTLDLIVAQKIILGIEPPESANCGVSITGQVAAAKTPATSQVQSLLDNPPADPADFAQWLEDLEREVERSRDRTPTHKHH